MHFYAAKLYILYPILQASMSDMNGSVPAQQPPSRVPGDGGEERTEDELSLALRLVTRAGNEPSRSLKFHNPGEGP